MEIVVHSKNSLYQQKFKKKLDSEVGGKVQLWLLELGIQLHPKNLGFATLVVQYIYLV